MFCINCGKFLQENSKFCNYCGTVQQPDQEDAPVQMPAQSQAPVSAQHQAPVSAQLQTPVPAQHQAPVSAQFQTPVPAQTQAPVSAQLQPPVNKQKKKVSKKFLMMVSLILAAAVLASSVLYFVFFRKETIYVMVEQTRFSGGEKMWSQEYEYDEVGRLLSISADYPEYEIVWNELLGVYENIAQPCDGVENQRGEYEYDEYGQVIEQTGLLTDGNSSFEYDYDDDGRIDSFKIIYDASQNYYAVYEISYDGDNIESITYEGQDIPWVEFEYDKKDRLTAVIKYEREGTIRCEYTYKGDHLVSFETYWGNYVRNDKNEEKNYRLYSGREYEYDGDLLIQEASYNETGYNQKIKYKYDDDGFLKKKTFYGADGEIFDQISFECDDHGNIIKAKYEDGSYVKYEYEAIEVTPEQADHYRSRFFRTIARDHTYSDMIPYHLIPDPRFDLIWSPDI